MLADSKATEKIAMGASSAKHNFFHFRLVNFTNFYPTDDGYSLE